MDCIKHIKFHGPTAFAAGLGLILDWIRAFEINANSQDFFIIVVLTRGGEVIDRERTRKLLRDAEDLPFSLFCIGIGQESGNFKGLI